jgi:hypothetical protein
MLRRIYASAAAVAMMAGVASAQDTIYPTVPQDAGLTPGAPLTMDPATGEPIVAGETEARFGGDVVVEDEAAVIAAEPDLDDETLLRRTAFVIPDVDSDYPENPSEAGLTPGAPTGGGSEEMKDTADVFIR